MVPPCKEALSYDDFTFNMPRQANAYFYGCSNLMELRTATELELGPKFSRQSLNDFTIGRGMLPPDLLAAAVKTEFLPAQASKP